jgi:hypothetical protein
MEKFLKIAIGLICVVTAIVWLRIMIGPMGVAERLAMNPEVPVGLSSIRSFIGAYCFCFSAFIFLALKNGDKKWLLVPLCLLVGTVFGRSLTMVMDGFHMRIVSFIFMEGVLFAAILGAYLKLPPKEE